MTRDKEAILGTEADVVVFTPLVGPDPMLNHADAMALLRSGKNVVLAHDYFHPAAIGATFAAEVVEACERGRSTVFATGSQPGFVAERLATTLAGHTNEVERIDILERMDCSGLAPHIYPLLGFGLDPDEFPRDRIIAMFDHMYRQTPYAVAATLGQDLARVDVDATFEVTDHDVEGTSVPVRKGTIAGTAFTWTGIVDDRPFVTLTCRWVAALDLPGWEVDDDWMITIEGTPSLRVCYARALSFAGGERIGGTRRGPRADEYQDSQSWTSVAAIVNAIPFVVAAPPGRLDPPMFAPSTHRRGREPLALR